MKSGKYPVLYEKKADCCGCTACFAVCPADAISMQPDQEGFLYPVIDEEKCLCCYTCVGVCPIKNSRRREYGK